MQFRVPAAVLLSLMVSACAPGEPSDQEAVQEPVQPAAQEVVEVPMPFQLTADQEAGKVVYETMCWSCHGSAGRGDGPAVQAGAVASPGDITQRSFSDGDIRRLQAAFQAAAGDLSPDNPHMANVLSIVEIEDFNLAVGYLPALTYPSELPGSAIAGYTNYMLRCQSCHGPTGQGDGPGAEVLDLAPANFAQDTLLAARDFQAAFDKIRSGGGGVHGSSMPAWGVMLKDGDVWDLVAFISTFQPGVLPPPPGAGG
ncbi:MAG: c-type cytochrome [Gemmatimonadetes bacterium]|nr:c-type cytochrome [Gemmatimonadota bacterium]NNM06152.1 c-type cytochrome [Gemmatimonadota bacterium]